MRKDFYFQRHLIPYLSNFLKNYYFLTEETKIIILNHLLPEGGDNALILLKDSFYFDDNSMYCGDFDLICLYTLNLSHFTCFLFPMMQF